MSAVVTLDRISMLRATERNGALVRMVREAMVSGLEAQTDWSIMTTALDSIGVPKYGDYLTNTIDNNAYYLYLKERNPVVLDNGKVKIELVYEIESEENQNIDFTRGDVIQNSVHCTVQQKSSNTDVNGEQVTVTHTFPDVEGGNHRGQTITQGVNFQYYEPQMSIYMKGIKQTSTPNIIARSVVGHVNDDEFHGSEARTWLCTSCSYSPSWFGAATSSNRYEMEFEFQYDKDTWDTTATFIDSITNKPPPDLVDGVGFKKVEKLPSCNFEEIIGQTIQGA